MIENPREIEIVGNEIEIKNIMIGGVPILLYIDRLGYKIVNGEKVLTVGDYKTGKVPNIVGATTTQSSCARTSWRLTPSRCMDDRKPLEVLYTQHEELRVVDLSDAAMNATLERFQKAWATHNELVNSTSSRPRRAHSAAGAPPSMCPAAKAEGKVAKMEFPISGGASASVRPQYRLPSRRRRDKFLKLGVLEVKANDQKEVRHMYEPSPGKKPTMTGVSTSTPTPRLRRSAS